MANGYVLIVLEVLLSTKGAVNASLIARPEWVVIFQHEERLVCSCDVRKIRVSHLTLRERSV